jgi:hypothetical protein
MKSIFLCCLVILIYITNDSEAGTKKPKPKKKEAYIVLDSIIDYKKWCCAICDCPPDIIMSGFDAKTKKSIGFINAESYRDQFYERLLHNDYSQLENGFNEETQTIIESKYAVKPEFKDRVFKVKYTETMCREVDHNAYGSCEGNVELHNTIDSIQEPITLYWLDKKNRKNEFSFDHEGSDSELHIIDFNGLNGFQFEGYEKGITISIIRDSDVEYFKQDIPVFDRTLVKKLGLKMDQQHGLWEIYITKPNVYQRKFIIQRIPAAG